MLDYLVSSVIQATGMAEFEDGPKREIKYGVKLFGYRSGVLFRIDFISSSMANQRMKC